MQVGGEQPGRIEAAGCEVVPAGFFDYLGIEFRLPKDFECLPLRVIIEAGEAQEGGFVGRGRGHPVLDEVLALAHADNFAGFGGLSEFGHR